MGLMLKSNTNTEIAVTLFSACVSIHYYKLTWNTTSIQGVATKSGKSVVSSPVAIATPESDGKYKQKY